MEAAFNDKRTLEKLSRMSTDRRVAFGAACCERMLQNYQTFMREARWGDVGPLRRALDAVWDACGGACPPRAELRKMLTQCEACAPDSEDHTSLHTSFAQDAVFSVCAVLDYLLDGDVDRIVAVPRFSTDSVDLYVQEREEMDPRDPLREQRILEHPLMQQELLRQRRDLAESITVTPGQGAALLALRARARQESNLALAS